MATKKAVKNSTAAAAAKKRPKAAARTRTAEKPLRAKATAKKAAKASREIKLATFNVNGVVGRLPQLLEWLAKETPDVVCLQELKSERFPARELAQAGYGAIWCGERSWNGVAILSRGSEPIETRRALPGDRDDVQCRYLEAAVHGVLIACIYAPNGNPQPGPKFDYKLRWLERLIAHAQSLYDCGQPVAIVGDYNVVPTDFDIYDPKSWRKDALLQPAARERYQELLAQGWQDVLRTRSPNERIYTFWDYFRNHFQRDAGLRIDHFLANQQLAPRVTGAGVDRWVRGMPHASDHAPTWITVQ